MNALERNRFTETWQAFGAAVPRPRAILCVSAHWYVPSRAVTAMNRPRTIHDFYGFPPALFDVRYPAPGDPTLAAEIADLLGTDRVGLDHDGWGLDHGTWSVLVHAFPRADVPVVQLSIDHRLPLEAHVAIGAALAPLRTRGVLIVGSGNLVHNLGVIDWRRPEGGYDWAERFDEAARDVLTTSPEHIGRLRDHPDWHAAVPTPDHFLPLAYVAGLAAAAGAQLSPLIEGCALGSISMTCYGLDVSRPPTASSTPSAGLPDATRMAPDATNT
jgi:4,5-DOPA dioxygenase extradiol